MKKRNILAVFLCALTLFALFPSIDLKAAMYDKDKINSNFAAVYNVENESFIFDKNGDTPISAATCAKVMTAVLALEHYGSLEKEVTVKRIALDGLDGATRFGLYSGEELTVRDLLYTMLVGNCNDSAAVLGYDIAGSTPAFAEKMNEKAKELGMENTVFKNATGLNAKDARTTVKDALLLSAYAMKVPGFKEAAGTTKYTVPATNKHDEPKTVYTKNYFLSKQTYADYYWEAAGGISSSYTEENGYSLITSYSSYSLSYICMCAGSTKGDNGKILVYGDTKELLRWAENEYKTIKILDSSKIFGEIPVSLSKEKNYVSVVPEASLYAYMPHDTDVEKQITHKYDITVKKLEAPVAKNAVVGKVRLYMDGKEIASCDLVTKFQVEKSTSLAFRSALFGTKMIIGVCVLIILACTLGIVRYALFTKISKKGDSPDQKQ